MVKQLSEQAYEKKNECVSHESIYSLTSDEDMLRTLQYLLTSNFHGRLQAPESALPVLHTPYPTPNSFLLSVTGGAYVFSSVKNHI